MVVSWCENHTIRKQYHSSHLPIRYDLYSMLHEKKIETTILIQQEGQNKTGITNILDMDYNHTERTYILRNGLT